MNKLSLSGVLILVPLLSLMFLLPSCVNNNYDMSDLNLEITPFESGITLPLGSTDQIRLDSLLKDVDSSLLGAGEDGVYAINFSDSLNMDDALSDFKDLIEIPDVVIAEEFSFEIGDIAVSDFVIPDVSKQAEIEAGMPDYVPDPGQLSLEIEEVRKDKNFMTLSDSYNIGTVTDTKIPISTLGSNIQTSATFDETDSRSLEIVLVDGITSVGEIRLNENAGVKVTMELTSSFLASGSLIPDVNLDLHELFGMENTNGTNILHLADDLILSEQNNYKNSKVYGVESLLVDSKDWKVNNEGQMQLNKDFSVHIDGEVNAENLMTTTRLLKNSKVVSLVLKLEFVDFNIEDVSMEIEPIKIDHNDAVDFTMEPLELPAGVKEVRNVTFTDDSAVDIVLGAENLDRLRGLGLELEKLDIAFPEGLEVEGTNNNNHLIINNVNLATGLNRKVHVAGLNLPAPVEGKISLTDQIKITAVAKASGTVHSADLPTDKADDLKAIVDVKTNIKVADFQVVLSDSEDAVAIEDEKIVLDIMSAEDMPAEVVSLDFINFEDTYITMSLDASALPSSVYSSMKVNLEIKMPEIIDVEGMDDKGYVRRVGTADSRGAIKIEPIKINALVLKGVDISKGLSDTLVVGGSVVFSDSSVDVSDLLSKDLKVGIDAAIKDVKISKLQGKVDFKVDPVSETVEFGDIAETLSGSGADVTLDFNYAGLGIEILTNLSVPVKADMEIIPYYDGKPAKDKKITAALVLNPAQSSAQEAATRYWLANYKDDRCPAGYTFVETDILGLLRNIPEKLELNLVASTDSTKDSVLEPMADYTLKANYMFNIPLEFGEDFEITYKDTISGLPPIVASLLAEGNKVKLAGEVTNSLPLALDLKLNFLDKNGEYVPAAEGAGVQKIAPCGPDGSASKTELGIVLALQKGYENREVASVELSFNASSGGITGVPVTENAFLQAVLQVELPEGITVDLEEIMDNNKE